MSRVRLLVLTVSFLLLVPATVTLASPSHLAVNTLTPELEEANDGEGSKLELEFTNITDGPAILTVDAVGQRSCHPTLSKNQLPPNQLTKLEVEVPAAPCNSSDDVLKLKITAELAAGASQVFLLDPEGNAPSKPVWEVLFAFPILLLLSLALAVLFLFKGWKPHSAPREGKDKDGRPAGKPTQWDRFWGRLRQPLTGLDVSTWKFNDNWATNVTAAGALLTGIFGATTAKAFLGEDAESLTALATVGAAITAILVGAAPIAVLATKSYAEHKGKPGNFFTVGGILLGAAGVTTAAIGQLGIIAYTGTELEIGIVAKLAIWTGFALGAALVLVYTRRSLKDLLERGTEEAAKEPGAEMEAAAAIATELEKLRKEIATGADAKRERPQERAEGTEPVERAMALPAHRSHHPRSALI